MSVSSKVLGGTSTTLSQVARSACQHRTNNVGPALTTHIQAKVIDVFKHLVANDTLADASVASASDALIAAPTTYARLH